VRVAEHAGKVYLDLANDAWEAVEIDAEGWRPVADPPVKFRRPRGMRPLPEPVPGGDLARLRPFVNVGTEADWILPLAWLAAALRPRGPYPILALAGQPGVAKSTLALVLRALADPCTLALRAPPRDAATWRWRLRMAGS
jgi:hypothetical protein